MRFFKGWRAIIVVGMKFAVLFGIFPYCDDSDVIGFHLKYI